MNFRELCLLKLMLDSHVLRFFRVSHAEEYVFSTLLEDEFDDIVDLLDSRIDRMVIQVVQGLMIYHNLRL